MGMDKGIMQDRQKHKIGVVGIGPGSGATFVAVNLALQLGQLAGSAAYIEDEIKKTQIGFQGSRISEKPLVYHAMSLNRIFKKERFVDFFMLAESGQRLENRVNLHQKVNWVVHGDTDTEACQGRGENSKGKGGDEGLPVAREKNFFQVAGKFLVFDSPKNLRFMDLIVAVVDPLPSRILSGLESYENLCHEDEMSLNREGKVLWVLNKDNSAVDRYELERFLKVRFDKSISLAQVEDFYRAEYECQPYVPGEKTRKEFYSLAVTIFNSLEHFSI